jgi:hypothetical protein
MAGQRLYRQVADDGRGQQETAGRYLVWEGWGAGFNNERMSLELAWALAAVLRRTLVLPALAGDHGRASGQFGYGEYFDINALAEGLRCPPAWRS